MMAVTIAESYQHLHAKRMENGATVTLTSFPRLVNWRAWIIHSITSWMAQGTCELASMVTNGGACSELEVAQPSLGQDAYLDAVKALRYSGYISST